MQQTEKFRAFFVVPPEVQLLDLSGPAHIFYEARTYGAPIENYFIGLNTSREELSSAGVSLGRLQDYQTFSLSSTDWILLPGLESHLLFDKAFETRNRPFFDWLNTQHRSGAKICSVCTGAYLLAQAGLLDERECTTHWKYVEDFRARFPKAKLQKDRLFVKDEHIYTSAGVSSGIDLSLFLLEESFGPDFAAKVAKEVVIYLRRTEKDPQLSVFLQYRNHLENRIHTVQDLLAQQLEKKKNIEELAECVTMSPRNLTRLFKKTTGITIGEYLEKLRVEKALLLLSKGFDVESISQECGLNSSNQLRALLKKHTQKLPSQLRL